ncbi:hypothetical protein AVEN_148-1 [Araneus ventricosus]|uniref:Uncharacterized protein n=1 Tax=Araneus ventricosus TaxID=182803 RepID=A0A4Y2D493_ARAVE|nr:hypothetical protein AVEN_148-1 [Araneus ventricosus]
MKVCVCARTHSVFNVASEASRVCVANPGGLQRNPPGESGSPALNCPEGPWKLRRYGSSYKKKRAVLRTAVTKYIQQLGKELKKNEPDDGEIEELLEHLSEKFESLKAVDRECENLYKPEEIDKELEAAEQCRDKIIT